MNKINATQKVYNSISSERDSYEAFILAEHFVSKNPESTNLVDSAMAEYTEMRDSSNLPQLLEQLDKQNEDDFKNLVKNFF